jgi:uncharacterized membrane protein HdeD (DUF308 family)
MRSFVLTASMTLFGAFGTVALVVGMLVTIGGLAERDSAVTSWYGLFAGLLLLILAATMYASALLSYVASVLTNDQTAEPALPPIDPARRPYGTTAPPVKP